MRGKVRFFLSLPVLVLLLLLAGAIVIIKSDFAAEKICGMLRSRLQNSLGLQTEIGTCSVDLLPPSLDVNELKLTSEIEGKLLDVQKARFELGSLALFAGDFSVDRVFLNKPQIHLHFANGRLTGIPSSSVTEESKPASSDAYRFPGKVRVVGGKLDLVVDGLGLLQIRGLDLKASALDDGSLELDLVVEGGSLDVKGSQDASIALKASRCQAVVGDTLIKHIQCLVKVGDVSMKMKGQLARTSHGWIPDLELSISGPMAFVHRVFPQVPKMAGAVVVSARMERNLGSNAVDGLVELDDFALGTLSDLSFRSEFQLDETGLHLAKIQASTPAGKLTGNFLVEFDDVMHTKGSLTVENASLIPALSAAGLDWHYIDLRGGGIFDINGHLKGKGAPRIGVNTRFDVEKMIVQTGEAGRRVLGFRGASVDAKAVFYRNRVKIFPTRISTGKSTITAAGTIRFSNFGLVGHVSSQQLYLEDICPIMGVNFQGNSALDIDLQGTVPDPILNAMLHVRDFAVEEHPVGIFQGKIAMKHFTLRAEQIRLTRHGGVVRASASLGVLPPYDVSMNANLSRIKLPELVSAIKAGQTPAYMAGWVGGKIEASGELFNPQLQFQLAFADLQLRGQHFSEAGAIGEYKAGAWRLDLMEARMGPGWIFVRGGISPNNYLDFTAYTTGLRAESLDGLLGHRDWLDYRMDLHIAIRGPLYAPALDGWARVYDTTLSGIGLPDTNIIAKASPESFQVDGKILGEAAKLHLKADLLRDLPFEGKVKFDTSHIGDLSAILGVAGSSARFAGQLSASGSLLMPSSVDAHLSVETANISIAGFEIKNIGSMEAFLDKGRVSISRCDLKGPQSRLTLTGSGKLMDGPRLKAIGKMDLRLLPLLGNWVLRARGTAGLLLELSGPWTSPYIVGRLDLDAKRVRVGGLPSDLRGIRGQVRISDTGLDIERLTGRFGGGDFSVLGTARFGNNLFDKVAVTAEVKKVRYKVSDKLWAIGTGVLTLTKEQDNIAKLKGQVRIEKGSYREQVSLVSLSDGMFRRRRALAHTYDRRNEMLELDIRLKVPGNFQTLYNFELVQYQAQMKGDLNLTGTNERLGLLGELESTNGRISYLSKEFQVQSTRVQFLDKHSIMPKFDVVATRSESVDRGDEGKNTYDVDLNLHGEGDDIKVSLHSSPPLDERDIITLLSLGVTSRDMERLKTDDLIGLGGEIFLRSLKAEERLRQYFPFPPGLIKPRYFRMRSRYSNRTQTTTPRVEAGVEVSIISPNLSLGYSRSLYVENDQILEFTYDLKRNISAQLRWESAGENNFGDLGLDLNLDWEW